MTRSAIAKREARVLSCLAIVLLFASATRASTITVDQSFKAPTNLFGSINDCCAFTGQIYTAGLTGSLAGVSVDIIEAAGNNFPLNIQIRSVDSGLPTTILGETTTTAFSLNDLIAFIQPIPQVAGTQYAIVVDFLGAPPSPGHGTGFWAGATGNLYPRGDLVSSFDRGIRWFAEGPNDFDYHFVTFVATVDTVPEPASLSLLATGLIGLARKRHLKQEKGQNAVKAGSAMASHEPACAGS